MNSSERLQAALSQKTSDKVPVDFGSTAVTGIVFWGGGVDTQKTLPFGTPDAVREEVLERCAIIAKDGGFVSNAGHNVQAYTPVKNIAAMYDAVKEFNGEN